MKYIGKFFLFLLVAVLVLIMVGAVIVLPLGLMGWGIYTAWDQDRAVRDAQAVPATVLSSRVQSVTSRSGKSRTTKHLPRILFRYEVGGATYQSDRVLPYGEITNFNTSKQLVDRHPMGKKIQVWHRPAEPGQAFLLREYSGDPYFFFFMGLGISVLPALLVVHGIFYRHKKQTEEAAARTPLPVGKPLRARVRANIVRGVWFIGWTALGGWHLVTRMPDAPASLSWGAIGAFAVVGLLFLHTAWRAQKVSGSVGDARVMINAEEFRPGMRPTVHVEQDLRSDVMVTQMKVGLICTKTVGSGKSAKTTKEYEQWVETLPQRRSADTLAARVAAMSNSGNVALGTLQGQFQLEIPADKPVTSTSSPTVQWNLKVETELPGPNYREEFAVIVKG